MEPGKTYIVRYVARANNRGRTLWQMQLVGCFRRESDDQLYFLVNRGIVVIGRADFLDAEETVAMDDAPRRFVNRVR